MEDETPEGMVTYPPPEFWGEVRSPWNPFPEDSEWGGRLDEVYRRRLRRRREGSERLIDQQQRETT